ncbi:DUF6668 family protein [Streptomyces qinglanensis]|uniref:Uncharacterized protein n=1 Tax=Streptomyces qinglanensis TaxID=943816 RepID=A0A1H9SBQ8_9ACTN|nr:hypothetical protein SAMN05421870_104424 [Streptomyces qinglanensis]
MSVPPPGSAGQTPAGPHMWVRGPTAPQPEQEAPERAEPSAPRPEAAPQTGPVPDPAAAVTAPLDAVRPAAPQPDQAAAPAQQPDPAVAYQPQPTAAPAPRRNPAPVPGSAPPPATDPHPGQPVPADPAQQWQPQPASPAAPDPAVQRPAPRATPRPGLGQAAVPRATAPGGGPVSWVGAHGGAGTSTLAELVGGSDLERRLPDPAQGEPGRMLLVARTHASGLRAASRALEALHSGRHPAGVDLLAVVLVADAPGRLPLHLMQRIRVLRSVADVHRVPWIPAWRGEKRSGALPKSVRLLAELAGGAVQRPGRREKKR